MPIKFRCPHCRQFLGISRSKAGGIADCPMCGKSLRVPNVDGSVDPLPKPRINLEDSALVDALGELASIGADSGEDAPTMDAAPSRVVKQHASAGVATAPKPITLDPLVPAKPVVAPKSSPAPVANKPLDAPQKKSTSVAPHETAASIDVSEATISDPSIELEKLAQAASGAAALSHNRAAAASPVARLWSRLWMPVVAFGLLAAGVYGMVTFLSPGSSGSAAMSNVAVDPEVADTAKAATTGQSGDAAVTGRVTYETESGDSRPDNGAIIVLLPRVRRGTVKLDVAGFLVGSDPVDHQVAAASLKLLGGNVVVANDRGEFAVKLPASGGYDMLVVSRHQSRPWEIGVEDDTQDLLGRFFLRPSTLLGQLAFNLQEVQYRGQGTSVRDVSFDRE